MILVTLRHILSVGEPLTREVIRWGMKVFEKRIHDTWWMTETGAYHWNFPGMKNEARINGKSDPWCRSSDCR